MKIEGQLLKKSFATETGEVREYYTLEIPLATGDTVDLKCPKDKANLIILSSKIK